VNRIRRVQVPVRRLDFETVADRNCVAARRGGEHRKAKGRSETQVNSIRPAVAGGLLVNGEAEVPYRILRYRSPWEGCDPWLNRDMKHKLMVSRATEGGWIRNVPKV